MREVIGRSNIQPILTGARQNIETAVQELMQKMLDDYRRRHPDHPGAVAEGRSARAGHRRLPRRAGRPRRPGARAERGPDLRQPRGAGSARPGRADPAGRRSLSRADRGRGHEARLAASSRSTTNTRRRRTSPAQRMYLETMERLLGGTDKIIIDSGGVRQRRRAVPAAERADAAAAAGYDQPQTQPGGNR